MSATFFCGKVWKVVAVLNSASCYPLAEANGN
jgi:hypothetical protein